MTTKQRMRYALKNESGETVKEFSSKADYREHLDEVSVSGNLDWSAGPLYRTRTPGMIYTLFHLKTDKPVAAW